MVKKLSKPEAESHVKEFFKDIKSKDPKQIKKIKKLAMRHNLPLKEKRRLFCKKCYSVYNNPKTRIKNKIKTVICKECGYVSRWKL